MGNRGKERNVTNKLEELSLFLLVEFLDGFVVPKLIEDSEVTIGQTGDGGLSGFVGVKCLFSKSYSLWHYSDLSHAHIRVGHGFLYLLLQLQYCLPGFEGALRPLLPIEVSVGAKIFDHPLSFRSLLQGYLRRNGDVDSDTSSESNEHLITYIQVLHHILPQTHGLVLELPPAWDDRGRSILLDEIFEELNILKVLTQIFALLV
jgi:hypothetical protein